MEFAGVNYIAVLVAAVAGMISGAVWYGVFAKQWMKAAGRAEEPKQEPKIYIVAIIAQVIIAYMMARLFGHFESISLVSGLLSALYLWIGFCVAPMAVNHRFQDKGWNLTIIDGGYWLVVFLLQGAIIGWFGV